MEKRETAAGKMEDLGREILQAARNELYLSMQFLDLAFGSLDFRMDRRTFFIGSEGEAVYFNPTRLAERYLEHPIIVQRAYLHTVFHCIFGHMFSENNEKEESLPIWNLACDVAVEYMIDQLEYPCVRQAVSEKRKELYRILEQACRVITAEAVYEYLEKCPEWMEAELLFLVDDHSFWIMNQKESKENKEKNSGNSSRDSQQKENSEEMRKVNWSRISEKLQLSLETFDRGNQKEAAALYQKLKVKNRPRQDYSAFLRRFAFVKEEIQVDEDSFDLSFYSFGMHHYGNMPLIEPLEYKDTIKIHEFVIVLDTSGSCSGSLIHQFMEKTLGILSQSQSFGKNVEIHVLQCDDAVNEDICIRNTDEIKLYLENLEIKGHGNTDFRPAFEYVSQLKEQGALQQLQGLLYFTDGYGIYPNKYPGYQVAFVFTEEDFKREKVPSWAMEIVL